MVKKKSIRRVFIANRGEICRRVAQTVRRMGLESACLLARKTAPQYLLGLIDHFVRVPEAESVELYLNAKRMVEIAIQAGADAVHPGYGFLSENETFAKMVIDAGLHWIGPSPQAMAAMAHKSEARHLAIKLGVPCMQGKSVPPDLSQAELIKLGEQVGYPILLKAAKGGGGKGMRVVEHAGELWEKAQHAFSEAKSYFGDGTLLIERYLAQARHIEVQILGDLHGHIITVGDRDCSVQRRYQKIIEEAPAVGLSDETRKNLHRCALQLAKEVSYSSCGTVEFLLDWTEKAQKAPIQDFYFLEMNTRLQVEHPVTELIFGLDLVEWQIRVASGEQLPQDLALKSYGHALEARIYAEDPQKNFFPSPGRVYCFSPSYGPSVRWDLGIDTVDEISPKFDPLVAKLIVHGASRKAAMERMLQVLEQSFLAGPVNNNEFLDAIFRNDTFQAGPVDTHFLQKHSESLHKLVQTQRQKYEPLAQELLALLEKKRGYLLNALDSDQGGIDERSRAIFAGNSVEKDEAASLALQVSSESSCYFQGNLNSKIVSGQAFKEAEPGRFQSFNYASIRDPNYNEYCVKLASYSYRKRWERVALQQASMSAKKQKQIMSPVPGRIVKILVQVEQKVAAQDVLFVLDSMKMEFSVLATHPGMLGDIKVHEGEQVDSGQVLADFKAEE